MASIARTLRTPPDPSSDFRTVAGVDGQDVPRLSNRPAPRRLRQDSVQRRVRAMGRGVGRHSQRSRIDRRALPLELFLDQKDERQRYNARTLELVTQETNAGARVISRLPRFVRAHHQQRSLPIGAGRGAIFLAPTVGQGDLEAMGRAARKRRRSIRSRARGVRTRPARRASVAASRAGGFHRADGDSRSWPRRRCTTAAGSQARRRSPSARVRTHAEVQTVEGGDDARSADRASLDTRHFPAVDANRARRRASPQHRGGSHAR